MVTFLHLYVFMCVYSIYFTYLSNIQHLRHSSRFMFGDQSVTTAKHSILNILKCFERDNTPPPPKYEQMITRDGFRIVTQLKMIFIRSRCSSVFFSTSVYQRWEDTKPTLQIENVLQGAT